MTERPDHADRGVRPAALVLAGLLALTGCAEGAERDPDQRETGANDATKTPDESSDRTVSPPATAEPPPPRTIAIAATGDVLPHSSVLESAAANAGASGEYDFGPMFAQIEPLISSADLALCHMETPLSADNTGLTQSRVLSFATPHEMATALRDAGYDGCDFASNHTMDRGLEGLAETEQVLRDSGLGYAGPTGEEEQEDTPQTYQVDGVSVAHLAYTYTLPNSAEPNTIVPDEAPWLGDSLWPKVGASGIVADAQAARADGADVVIVSMHWGQEYRTDPSADQTTIAETLLTSNEVDLILGTHVHVPQPCAKINDRYVLYGLGNSLSNQSPDVDSRLRPETQEGMVATVQLTVRPDGGVTSELNVQPTRVSLAGHIIEPVGRDDRPESAERTLNTVSSLGQCRSTSPG